VIVLGVDPGSVAAGWGVVVREGSKLTHIDAGVFRPPRGAEFSRRLAYMHAAIVDVVAAHSPQSFAIESVFTHANPRSALQLGHARGVFLLAAAQADLSIHEYAPATVKKAVTGSGAADKEQVRFMVERLLGVKIEGPLDRSDALAVAICHAQSSPLLARVKSQDAPRRAGRGKLRRTKG
jgi:crossover junction endodeoxyribonuclease RuvC